MWEALATAKRLLAISDQFASTRPHKGANTLSYVNDLKKDGFTCRLQYRSRFHVSRGANYGSISTTPQPGVECMRVPSRIPECVEFRVALIVAWKNPEMRTLRDAIPELGNSVIENGFFLCEQEATTPEIRAKVADGIANGYVVMID